MSVPEKPSNTGFVEPQFGYKDLEVKTHKYKDSPTPYSGKQSKAGEFFASKTDKDHQKKYAKQIGRRLFDILIRQVCH